MASHCRVQSCSDLSYMVFWVIVTLISGVDNSPFVSYSEKNLYSTLQIARFVENHRLKRTTGEEAIHLPISERNSPVNKAEQELNNDGSNKNIFLKEGSESFQPEEHTKIKQTKQFKYFANYSKNHSTNKIKLETGLSSSIESFNEKQKSSLFSPDYIKYPSPYKKDTKLNINHTDHLSRPNLSASNEAILDRLKLQINSDDNEALNDTQEMNDQPVNIANELSLNATDVDDDSLLQQNSSIHSASHNYTNADSRVMPSFEGFDIVLICSIILGTFLVLGVIGGGGYVVYRRRIWNKPQTLSDKCSNADSSGYIDDSTLRENSEEMYSLDNDSFLNSLEAMTIQNYWTDNVKHTKL